MVLSASLSFYRSWSSHLVPPTMTMTGFSNEAAVSNAPPPPPVSTSSRADAAPAVTAATMTTTMATMASTTAPTTTATIRRRRFRRRSAICPDPESLYDILRRNSGASLYVLPILWTDLHSRLLVVEFTRKQAAANTSAKAACSCYRNGNDGDSGSGSGSGSDGSATSLPASHCRQPSAVAETMSACVTTLLSAEETRPFAKSRAMKRLLATLFPATMSQPKSVAELDVHFGKRVFRGAVRVPVVWKAGDAATASFDSAATRPMGSFASSWQPEESAVDLGGGSGGSGTARPGFGCRSNRNSQTASPTTPTPATPGPVLAYVNRAHLSMIRQNLFRILPGPENGDRQNTPVSRLQFLRSKQLVPGDADRDAYMVGVFLAMAQAHVYESSPVLPLARPGSRTMPRWHPRGEFHPKGMLLTPDFRSIELRIIAHDDAASEFIVYTSVVTAAFLQRFSEPTKAATATATAGASAVAECGMSIEYTRVPAWPILGLRERLGTALGQTNFDDCDLFRENSNDSVALESRIAASGDGVGCGGALQTTSLKRKRPDRKEAAAIWNVGFETDAGSGSSSSSVSGSGSSGDIDSGIGVRSVGSTRKASGGAASSASASNAPANSARAISLSPHKKKRRTSSLSSSLAVC